jgi:dienelactone hydrolase
MYRALPALLLLAIFQLKPALAGDPVAWLAEIQTPPAEGLDAAPELPSLLGKGPTAINSVEEWTKQRAAIRQRWIDYMNPWSQDRGSPRKYRVIDSEVVDGIVRERISYEVEKGETEEAYLLRPIRISGSHPGVLVFHSTINHSIRQPAGVEGAAEKAFAWQMAKRGAICLCPRNFLWPTNDKIEAKQETENFHKAHPKSKGMARMLWDAQVALDLLLSIEGVDSKSIAAVGHSLGAKEVLYLAAFDERVKVTVSSEGGVGTTYSNWDAAWYLGPEIKTFPHEHHELLGLIAPRAFLLIGGDSADGDRSWPFIERALPVYKLYSDRPRIGLYNHKEGHSVPAEAERRIYQWLETELAE